MDLKTFFGAINKEVISQMAISKSICGNLKSLCIARSSVLFIQISKQSTIISPSDSELYKTLPLEEARHAHAGPAAGRGPEIGGTGMLAGDRDVRVHLFFSCLFFSLPEI
jgi:hypothetical protein